ncbi:MAG: hypothetical protein M0C28_02580 [Candidatus Moduliflexus flocculans]|nr:hypothetical protein [Candidatus Moduliflexus flocculans]
MSDVFGKLEASVDQGDLLVENFSGAVDVTVGTGDADVEVLDLREEDTITITCRRGNIVLRLEPGVGAIVEADAPRGRVRSDFDLGVELPAATVKGWIGEGGPNIILRAPNGRVEIVKIKAIRPGRRRGARAAKGRPWTTSGSRMSGTRDPEEEKKSVWGLAAALFAILAAVAALYYFVFVKKPAKPAAEASPAAETVRPSEGEGAAGLAGRRAARLPRRRPRGERCDGPGVRGGPVDGSGIRPLAPFEGPRPEIRRLRRQRRQRAQPQAARRFLRPGRGLPGRPDEDGDARRSGFLRPLRPRHRRRPVARRGGRGPALPGGQASPPGGLRRARLSRRRFRRHPGPGHGRAPRDPGRRRPHPSGTEGPELRHDGRDPRGTERGPETAAAPGPQGRRSGPSQDPGAGRGAGDRRVPAEPAENLRHRREVGPQPYFQRNGFSFLKSGTRCSSARNGSGWRNRGSRPRARAASAARPYSAAVTPRRISAGASKQGWYWLIRLRPVNGERFSPIHFRTASVSSTAPGRTRWRTTRPLRAVPPGPRSSAGCCRDISLTAAEARAK